MKQVTQVTVRRGALTGWLADRGLGVKIIVPAAAMAIAAALIGIVALAQLADTNQDLARMKNQQVKSLQEIARLRDGFATMMRGALVFT